MRDQASQHTGSLKKVDIEKPAQLDRFIKSFDAARRLGKALFWDQQVGSDGQACASCHFHAGADNRSKNELGPGGRNRTPGIDTTAFNDATGFGPNLNDFGPNYQLTAADFPFHKLANPQDRESKVLSDTNDVLSSQGVHNATFVATKIPFDEGTPSLLGAGAIFNEDGALTRNVEPRSTPTVINAAFNHRSFSDGRARFEFNGVNDIGDLDPRARIVERDGSSEAKLVRVRIERSSLASQADGPPTSDLEMSFAGRRIADIGRKLLKAGVVPLGLQDVDATDSLLGALSKAPNHGIAVGYADLVKQAFAERWWDVPGFVVDVSGVTPVLKKQAAPIGPNQFTVMEHNFSLFLGLAIQEYEKTLISDDTPFDRFMDGNDAALSVIEREGLAVFVDKGKCVNCHGGPELTNASLNSVRNDQIIERMIMGDDGVAVYDNGFYNIGVRPTLEDIGIGATIGPLDLPLSSSRLYQRSLQELVPQLRATTPSLTEDEAIRLANLIAKVPRIRARPEEAERLLGVAVPKAVAELMTARDAIALIVAPASDAGASPPSDAATRLAEIDALLTKATTLVTTSPSSATYTVEETATKIDALAALVGTDRSSNTGRARALIAPGKSLLPDPIDPGPDPSHPFGPPLRPEERVAVDGAHKTPSLRNLSETAPHFHNGGQATIEQVVAFYNRGGDFARTNQRDLDPDIQRLDLTAHEEKALVAFLRGALTDERVRYDRAPFDHPSLSVPNGGLLPSIGPYFPAPPILERRVTLPAVGAAGSTVKLGTPKTPFASFLQPLE